jgi:hypothetical protein
MICSENRGEVLGEPGVRTIGVLVVALMAAMASGPIHSLQARPAVTPTVRQTPLTYLGSFRLPDLDNSGVGMALTFNPLRNSLYDIGWDGRAYATAEVTIPGLGGEATIIQPLRDSLEGRLPLIGNDSGNGRLFGGQLVYNNKLYQSAFLFYDANGIQAASHFSRPLDLSTTGQVAGPFRVGNLNPGFVSGYMGLVPSEWQAALGGPAVTGNCCLSIIGRTSFGPSLSSFNPEAPAAATPLVYYDEGHQTLGEYGRAVANPRFNGSTRITGIVIPRGSSSALFFGSTGKGVWCYGDGPECNDPSDGNKGDHAYPYVAYVWAYDLNDLAAVRSGQRQPWEVLPYATWELSDVGPTWNNFGTGGAAYDPVTQRIYLLHAGGDDGEPVVRVYSATLGAGPAPSGDIVAPTVTLTSPTDGSTVTGTVVLTAAASDNVGVSEVSFFINGVALGSRDVTAPYQTTWATGSVTAGTYAIQAEARDAAGNRGVSRVIHVTVHGAGTGTPGRRELNGPASGRARPR